MAPEQTGRMNRSMDSGSDLYALGVTLYEMMTGSLPFTAPEPMERVHCHIPRQALPPLERSQNVPVAVSPIIKGAARQDSRSALSDRGRPRKRPPALSYHMGASTRHRLPPAARSRRFSKRLRCPR